MKKQEIQIGKRYTDGNGNIREVLAFGAQFKTYPSQHEEDNLQYKVIAKKRGPYFVGFVNNSTKASFASWAKTETN